VTQGLLKSGEPEKRIAPVKLEAVGGRMELTLGDLDDDMAPTRRERIR
jgi:hypothetical protein